MRLKEFEIQSIQTLSKKYFGKDARVFLFGSRVDDALKGGDIDLFVSATDENVLNIENKILFLVHLKRTIGDRKIDVVLDTESTRRRASFYQSISTTRIELSDLQLFKIEKHDIV